MSTPELFSLVTGAFLSLEKDQKLGRASALQVATLSLIDGPKPGQSHPSAWAPFVLAGDGGR